MSTGNGSLDIAEMFDFSNRQLGVVLALVERPAIIAQLLTQLDASGGVGKEVKHWHDMAIAALDTVP